MLIFCQDNGTMFREITKIGKQWLDAEEINFYRQTNTKHSSQGESKFRDTTGVAHFWLKRKR